MNYQSNRPDIAQAGPVQWLAIGIQPQWGKILGDTVNLKIINFPVSFNECFGGLALFNGDPVAAAEYATITDITNTNFKIYMYANNAGTGYANANIFYLFLGAQPQWGYQTVHGTNPVTYDLPIPFEEAPFTVAISTGNSGNHASCGGFTKTTIVLRAGTTAGVWDTVGFFIIGCQLQWGFIARNANTTFTFPIMFTTLYAAMRTAYGVSGRDPSWDEIAIPSATVKQINLGSCYWASYVIAIGI